MNVTISTGGGVRTYPVVRSYSGGRLPLSPASPLLAVDTEFDPQTHALALVSVFDGCSVFLLPPASWPTFLRVHADAVFVAHNAACDWWILHANTPAELRLLWVQALDSGRVRDTMILDQLLRLAIGRTNLSAYETEDGTPEAAPVVQRRLSAVAADVLGATKDDSDPYRMRYGELVGRDWNDPTIEPGFWSYAARDPVLTYLVYREQFQTAHDVLARFLPASSRQTRVEVRPDAVKRWGHLSEVIQVQGAVALAAVERLGVGVDQARLTATEATLRKRMKEIENYLVSYHPDVIPPRHGLRSKLHVPGSLRRTESGCLSLCDLSGKLTRIAERLKLDDVPMSDGKLGGISRSAKAWQRYADRDRFLQHWCEYTGHSKLCGFIEQVRGLDRIHPRYNTLVTTGRTSCYGPNLQQMPKGDWRRHFIPTKGYKFFVGDLAGAELCTFSAYARWAYGQSVMGDQLAAGRNVHAFFAAAILGTTYDEFLALKTTDPKRFAELRQIAKPANFGLMGGMGAEAFRHYAAAPPYNVTLSEADAVRLIDLWETTFPEGKLHRSAYPEFRCLARNLGCTVAELQNWLQSKPPYYVHLVEQIIGGRTANRQGRAYSPWTIADVWGNLAALCHDPELRSRLLKQSPSPELRSAVFRRDVAILTGRVVADVRHTDLRNYVFQGLAADVKVALWRLVRDGFRVAGFVHDEILVEVQTEDEGQRVARTIEETMQEICGQDVPFTVEWHLTDCWEKP